MDQQGELDPVGDGELLEDPGQVRLHRREGQVEARGDVGVGQALGDEVRVTVIAAGFDGGHPQKRVVGRPAESRPMMQSRPATTVEPQAQAPQAPSRPDFDDDLDVPDFMK